MTTFEGQTVALLRDIKRLLAARLPAPAGEVSGGAYQRVEVIDHLESGIASDKQTAEERQIFGFFSAAYNGPGFAYGEVRLRWYPGTEAAFPTFDQMARAKSAWPTATEWDLGALGDGSHMFGIPLTFA